MLAILSVFFQVVCASKCVRVHARGDVCVCADVRVRVRVVASTRVVSADGGWQ